MEALADIVMTCGVNDKGEGFVTVAAHGNDGTVLLGQLTPDEMRMHALAYMGVAEAADQDAAVLRVIRKLGVDEKMASIIIHELRSGRKE